MVIVVVVVRIAIVRFRVVFGEHLVCEHIRASISRVVTAVN